MKKRGSFFLFILIIFFIVLIKYNGIARGFFLDLINPIKIAYKDFMNVSDKYLQQKDLIAKLKEQNSKLQKEIIEKNNYIEQLSKVYRVIPSLVKQPYKSIYLVDTISYVKLNKLNEIMLTVPKNFKLQENKIYGLVQKDYAAGIAIYKEHKLYGYLLSNTKTNFSVYIGKDKINGVAQGIKDNKMIIKYIPRWSKVNIGDIVKTSGLDNIFYPGIAVGKIVDVRVLDRYKEATIEVFANLSNPGLFLLITDATPYLTNEYMPNTTFPNKVYPFIPINKDDNKSEDATQTKDMEVEPSIMKESDYFELFNKELLLKDYMNLELNEKSER